MLNLEALRNLRAAPSSVVKYIDYNTESEFIILLARCFRIQRMRGASQREQSNRNANNRYAWIIYATRCIFPYYKYYSKCNNRYSKIRFISQPRSDFTRNVDIRKWMSLQYTECWSELYYSIITLVIYLITYNYIARGLKIGGWKCKADCDIIRSGIIIKRIRL